MALSRAELRDGKKIGHWDVAAEVGAQAAGLDLDLLQQCAKSPAIEERVRKSTAEFHALQVTQRPTFVIDTPIGDRAVFSGFAKARTDRRNSRRDVGRHRRIRSLRRAFRRSARLTQFGECDCAVFCPLRNALPVSRCRIQLPLGSGDTADRSERSSQARRFLSAACSTERAGRLRQEENGVSLTPSSPAGDNSFCNNKFV